MGPEGREGGGGGGRGGSRVPKPRRRPTRGGGGGFLRSCKQRPNGSRCVRINQTVTCTNVGRTSTPEAAMCSAKKNVGRTPHFGWSCEAGGRGLRSAIFSCKFPQLSAVVHNLSTIAFCLSALRACWCPVCPLCRSLEAYRGLVTAKAFFHNFLRLDLTLPHHNPPPP